ncbi:MAG: hypothetical protein ACFFDH_01055 [Promethearchaeota archaeon]
MTFTIKHEYEVLSHKLSVDEESFLTRWNGFLRHTAQPVLEVVAYS